jgi:class 3 adenylate cyclase
MCDMEPQIQYVTTSAFYDQLCRNRLVIVFDPRGTGMSDRDVQDYSLDSRLLDIQAVVDSLGLDTFALNAVWHGGPMAIAYAARYPDRVTNLVLDDTFANARVAIQGPQERAMRELYTDWEALTEHIAFSFAGAGREDARRYAEFLRSCTTHDAALNMWRTFNLVDVTELLPEVQAPTLIMQHSGIRGLNLDHSRQMASLIPNARLVMIEGKEVDDLDRLLSVLDEFLGDELASTAVAVTQGSTFRTILFTDLVDHTEMMQRLGDDKGRDVLREHERITREVLAAHDGAEVKTMGDGFMASFGSVTKAMDCAIGLQRAFASHGESMPEPLHVRVGLNAGEPIEEDGDLFGSTVILASRIAAQAGAGEILIPEPLRHLLFGKSYVYSDRGEFVLKGFEDSVKLWELRWKES